MTDQQIIYYSEAYRQMRDNIQSELAKDYLNNVKALVHYGKDQTLMNALMACMNEYARKLAEGIRELDKQFAEQEAA